jgi:hypothetical protein
MYIFTVNIGANQLQLFRYENATAHSLASTSRTFSEGVWYRVEVDWTASGDITVTVYDNGSSISNVSATDSTFNAGGIAARLGGGQSYDVYWDEWRVIA